MHPTNKKTIGKEVLSDFLSKVYTLKSFDYWLALQMWMWLSNHLVASVANSLLVSVFWSSQQVPVTFSLLSVLWLVPVLYLVFALSQFLSKRKPLTIFLVWSFQFKRHDVFHWRHWLAALYCEAVSMTWFREEIDAFYVSPDYTPLVSFNKRVDSDNGFLTSETDESEVDAISYFIDWLMFNEQLL